MDIHDWNLMLRAEMSGLGHGVIEAGRHLGRPLELFRAETFRLVLGQDRIGRPEQDGAAEFLELGEQFIKGLAGGVRWQAVAGMAVIIGRRVDPGIAEDKADNDQVRGEGGHVPRNPHGALGAGGAGDAGIDDAGAAGGVFVKFLLEEGGPGFGGVGGGPGQIVAQGDNAQVGGLGGGDDVMSQVRRPLGNGRVLVPTASAGKADDVFMGFVTMHRWFLAFDGKGFFIAGGADGGLGECPLLGQQLLIGGPGNGSAAGGAGDVTGGVLGLELLAGMAAPAGRGGFAGATVADLVGGAVGPGVRAAGDGTGHGPVLGLLDPAGAGFAEPALGRGAAGQPVLELGGAGMGPGVGAAAVTAGDRLVASGGEEAEAFGAHPSLGRVFRTMIQQVFKLGEGGERHGAFAIFDLAGDFGVLERGYLGGAVAAHPLGRCGEGFAGRQLFKLLVAVPRPAAVAAFDAAGNGLVTQGLVFLKTGWAKPGLGGGAIFAPLFVPGQDPGT